MTEELGNVGSPPLLLDRLRIDRRPTPVRFTFEHRDWYLPDAPELTLHGLCFNGERGLVALIDDDGGRLDQVQTHLPDLSLCHYDPVYLEEPLPLTPVRIPKPWGAEIWHTGIEARGVSCVGNVPLPWLMTLGGGLVLGSTTEPPILLKVLDPLPDEVYGDLYFEMHAKKTEVYVVTDVDRSAWPDGNGAIRYGFDRSGMESGADFREAWLNTVRAYRQVRQQIDERLDRLRAQDGFAPADVVPPATLDRWKQSLDGSLAEREARLRAEMDAFTRLEPLRPGDVVRVKPFTPHSLQHGVRVIEFQTPHYERFILSFAQKVLTQDHWDTEAALEYIDWEARLDRSLPVLSKSEGCLVEQAADFNEFEVLRVKLEAGACYTAGTRETYSLLVPIEGDAALGEVGLAAERALLLPAAMGSVTISAKTASTLLLATPKPQPAR